MAGCEKYVCNCSEIQQAIDDYNSSVDGLKSAIQGMNIIDKLSKATKSINTGLRSINGGVKPGEATSNDNCGCPERMQGEIAKSAGALAGNTYKACCLDGQKDDPWNAGPRTPCGKDADNALINVPLFTCDPLKEPEGSDDLPELIRIKCEQNEKSKCDEPGANVSIIKEGQKKGRVGVTAIDQLGIFTQDVQKIITFLNTVGDVANGDINVGGANGNLKFEACLTRLLHNHCTQKLNNPKRKLGNGEGQSNQTTSCKNASTNYGQNCNNNYECCWELMNDLAKNSLSYGHGYGKQPGSDGWTHNGIPDCGKNKIKALATIFIPLDKDENTEIQNYLNAMNKRYPGGCRGLGDFSDRGGETDPITDFEVRTRKACVSAADCPSWDKSDTNAPGLSQADKDKILGKQKEIERYQDDINNFNAGIKTLRQNIELLTQKIKTESEKGKDVSRYENMIENNINSINDLTIQIEDTREKILKLENEITEILGNPTFPGGQLVTFEYRYCPANSTPPQSPFPPDGGETGGPGAGGSGGMSGQTHRNFWDLINNIQNKLRDSSPCTGSPLDNILDNCLEGQQGRNPWEGGAQTGPNTGPTTKPNSPCNENDSVRFLPGVYNPGERNNPCPENQNKKAECIQRLLRVLKSWQKQSTTWKNKLNKINDVLGNIKNAIDGINNLMDRLQPPDGDDCGNINTQEAIAEIQKAMEAVNKAIANLDSLNELAK